MDSYEQTPEWMPDLFKKMPSMSMYLDQQNKEDKEDERGRKAKRERNGHHRKSKKKRGISKTKSSSNVKQGYF